MSYSGDSEVLLTESLSPSTEDEGYTMSTDFLESVRVYDGGFEQWLFKNGIDYVVTTHNTQNMYQELTSDPVLPFIIENKIVDDPSNISNTGNSLDERLGEYQKFIKLDPDEAEYKPDHRPNILKPAVSKRRVNGTFKTFCENLSKSDILIECIKTSMYLVMTKDSQGLIFTVRDADGLELIAPHLIQVSESSNYHETFSTQTVINVNLLEIAPQVEVKLPQLVTNCGAKIHLCPIEDCQKAFLQLTSAKLHTLTHLGIKPYKCDIADCPWAFYTPFKLSRHKETHSKQKNFICDYPGCQRGFTTVYNLNSHRKSHEKPANLLCPVESCQEAFQTEKERRVHCKTHSDSEAPYHCPVDNCKKSFFLQSSLQTHTRSHSHKESELVCKWPKCGRMFDTPYRLKEHTRKHTGVRPYICSYEDCTWSFPTASKLKRHQITHTNERKFHCTMGSCAKKFLRSEHLKDHTLTHVQHRPIECGVCGATFSGKSGLYGHIRKLHPDRSQAAQKAVPSVVQEENDSTQDSQHKNQDSQDKPSAEVLLEQAIQSLGVPSDMMIGTGLLPDEPMELLENDNFSTVNLRDLQ